MGPSLAHCRNSGNFRGTTGGLSLFTSFFFFFFFRRPFRRHSEQPWVVWQVITDPVLDSHQLGKNPTHCLGKPDLIGDRCASVLLESCCKGRIPDHPNLNR
ncbi:hypothetical protein BO99DRAFT_106227 [Aspergillus violaceofuscus CBS 115571]|uniref:Uncharacterized protein n=1 Tax=Aspergillus violaceofuscus (strain CBS 115571) TaxID=1450538 RepID=A0A2V5HWT1_ASPV1|nr:hypothetical protein BO99DRAFT_106227 [Aspergillus violaceofuscus CBS 115571]